MQNRYRRSIVALCCVVLAGALACREVTAPDANATLFNRARGTYELSVVLATHTYSVSCSPPSSSNPYPTCRDTTVALTGSRLYGFVTLGDTVLGTPPYTPSPYMAFEVPAGTLTAVDCDTCSSSALLYPDTEALVGRDSLTFGLTFQSGGPLELQGDRGSDLFTGKAKWWKYIGSTHRDYYTGTFVAKRQP